MLHRGRRGVSGLTEVPNYTIGAVWQQPPHKREGRMQRVEVTCKECNYTGIYRVENKTGDKLVCPRCMAVTPMAVRELQTEEDWQPTARAFSVKEQ